MKKIFFAGIAMAACGVLIAQTPEDALRYSWLTTGGTARVQSLGGASGAIGGEISTIFSNPANIGFYKTGDAVLSLGVNTHNNKSTYIGTADNAKSDASVFLGTSGIVFGKPSYNGGSIKSSAFGVAVNKTADFNNVIYYRGKNTQSSYSDYFLDDVRGVDPNIVAQGGTANDRHYQFGSSLALNTYWIDYDKTKGYTSTARTALTSGGLFQEQKIKTNGGITELAIAGAGNVNETVFFGGSIGLPMLDYRRTTAYTEADATNNTTNGFDYGYIDEELTVKGMGVNVKAGVVFKPTDAFRFGFSAHTPTWYMLTDDYWSKVGTGTENYPTSDGKKEHYLASDDSQYPKGGIGKYEYRLATPYKLMGSFSLMFGDVHNVSSQKGFLTGDVEYVNYAANNFKDIDRNSNQSTNSYFKDLNSAVDNAYKGALNARLGAELKFNTFMARVGGAYYGNPYKDIAGEKGDIKQITGGIGYRNKGFFVDLGYIQSFKNDVIFPYRTKSPVPFYGATINSSSPRVLLTLGIKI